MTEELVVDSVYKSFGDQQVLNGLALTVGAGEVVAVLGQSGCGKTTLLRIVAGLERADAGSISIGGDDVTLASPASRHVGMVFQHHALLPHLSVAENIGFGLHSGRRKAGRYGGDSAARIARVASLVRCAGYLDRLPSTLSGGERQRVALARALVRSPRLVLLDEPLSSLDAQDRAILRTDLRRALVESGATSVHVTHDQAEAFAIGDQVAVVGDGVLQQIGSADELYDTPATLPVASLIGTPRMNLFAVETRQSSTEPDVATSSCADIGNAATRTFRAGPFRLAAAADLAPLNLTAGVRARDVHLVPPGRTGSAPGVVVAVEIIDDAAVAHVDVEGHVVRTVVARSARPMVGDRVAIKMDIDRFHLFDTMSGIAVHQPA